MGQLRIDLGSSPWTVARDADPDCREIQRRHYSRRIYRDGRDPKKFVGPGEHVVLITPDLDALFVWRKFKDDAIPKQAGVNCSIFRNEGPRLSSTLILEAEIFACRRWPKGDRFYTYVNADRIRSTNPGYCFIKAGWVKCGTTKGGLVILEKVRTNG